MLGYWHQGRGQASPHPRQRDKEKKYGLFDANEDVFLGAEMIPQRSLQHTGVLGDGGGGYRSESPLVEQHEARFEQLVACLGRKPFEGTCCQQAG